MDYAFHFYNSMAETGIMLALEHCLGKISAPPVVLCIGSDLAVGDSLGPVTGTLLKRKHDFRGFVYGTLNSPVTAKEVKYLNNFLRKTHPFSKIIAVDAAVGDANDVGLIKVSESALRPGSGANKKLGKIGDVSVLGIVARKNSFSYSTLNLTRLNLVYSMAEAIAGAISALSLKTRETVKIVNE